MRFNVWWHEIYPDADSVIRGGHRECLDHSVHYAKDGPIRQLDDFMIDDKTWAIRHLVIETGHWYSGRHVVVSPKDVDCIKHEESTVFLNVTKDSILNAAEYHAPRAPF